MFLTILKVKGLASPLMFFWFRRLNESFNLADSSIGCCHWKFGIQVQRFAH